MEQQQQPDAETQQEWASLANEVESRLRDYLDQAVKEYPPGCQADWLAGVVCDRLLPTTCSPASLVKLTIYLMESLADVSNAYEEFYSKQLAELREDALAAHAQVAALEDENARLREQLHQRAEELRLAQAAAGTAVNSTTRREGAKDGAAAAGTVNTHRFDEAVEVEAEDDDDEEDKEEQGKEERQDAVEGAAAAAICRLCGRGGARQADSNSDADTAAQIAALKAELADWEADMAEKVQQNVELAAQLEACQRQLARKTAPSSDGGPAAAGALPRSFFSGMPLLKKKT